MEPDATFELSRIHTQWLQMQRQRRRAFEKLEDRRLLVAEGSPFQVNLQVKATDLLGTITATADWGDGTSSPLTVSAAATPSKIKAKIDYSLDSGNFFHAAERRLALETAIDNVLSRFTDDLAAIVPSGQNTWSAITVNPSTGQQIQLSNRNILANEILVFAGARDLPGNSLGEGGLGGANARGTQAWVDLVLSRGQAGALTNPATDFSVWGGHMSFDNATKWHFGLTTEGLDADETDFISVAMHEFSHVLGWGTPSALPGSKSAWERLVSGTQFIGPNARAEYDGTGNVPLENDGSHWKRGTTDEGMMTLMLPLISKGERRLLTPLDLAALKDIGWQAPSTVATVTGEHVFGDDGNYPVSVTLKGSRLGERTIKLSAPVTNVAPTLTQPLDTVAIVGQELRLARLGEFSDPGFDLPNATPPKLERFTFRINWGVGSPEETGDATIQRMGSAGVPTLGFFPGVHTYQQLGRFKVTITLSDDDRGTDRKEFFVEVLPPPNLVISADRNAISENAGPNAATLTIERIGFPLDEPLEVTLSSSDSTELRLPATQTFPAGVSTILVPIEAVDDDLLDGTVSVNIRVAAGNVLSNIVSIDVLDFESLIVQLTVNRLREDAGRRATKLTINRSNTDRDLPLEVALFSSNSNRVPVPTTTIIGENRQGIVVNLDVIDNAALDGEETIVLSAQAEGYFVGQVELILEDFEPLQLVTISGDLGEEEAMRNGEMEVSIPFLAPGGGIRIDLSTSSPADLEVPTSVRVPAGSDRVRFPIRVIDDLLFEGDETVTIFAMANGFVSSEFQVTIIDDDEPQWHNAAFPVDVNGSGNVTPLDALLVINHLVKFGLGPLNPDRDLPGPPFIDVSNNGSIEPLDALLVINHLNRR